MEARNSGCEVEALPLGEAGMPWYDTFGGGKTTENGSGVGVKGRG